MTQDDLPDRIGGYQILHRLAVGGMAEVFLGRAAGTGDFEKLVAIKRVPERKRVVDERRKADDDGQRRAPSKKQKQDKLPYESL